MSKFKSENLAVHLLVMLHSIKLTLKFMNDGYTHSDINPFIKRKETVS